MDPEVATIYVVMLKDTETLSIFWPYLYVGLGSNFT